MRRSWSLALVLCLLWSPLAVLADFTGKVVSISDGDTLSVLRDHEQINVRLVEIDAPEMGQPYGTRSKQTLAAYVFGQDVRVAEHGKDRYGRVLGRVFLGGMDVNAEMVRQGMAWVYRKYATDSTLYALEAEARDQLRGLWGDPDPMPPWEWRRARR